jgi:hypothetical protein
MPRADRAKLEPSAIGLIPPFAQLPLALDAVLIAGQLARYLLAVTKVDPSSRQEQPAGREASLEPAATSQRPKAS